MIVVTGSGGLVGSEAVTFFAAHGYRVRGFDTDVRQSLFGPEASVEPVIRQLKKLGAYQHHYIDIRDWASVEYFFRTHGEHIEGIVHAAAQPSHDWAARDPFTDYNINASGTLYLLEAVRRYSPKAKFIYVSTNKVYGDWNNRLEYKEMEKRYEIVPDWAVDGFNERTPIDRCKHSLFGCSKLAADLYVQEYARYFGMQTVCFRCGCITGPAHRGARLHGFLSYLVKCIYEGKKYTIYGYKGKQVRDNIHAHDLVTAFYEWFQNPVSEVYNMGGSRYSNISILEAIDLIQEISGKKALTEYLEEPRSGDHQWWVTDVAKFKKAYPGWQYVYGIKDIIGELCDSCKN